MISIGQTVPKLFIFIVFNHLSEFISLILFVSPFISTGSHCKMFLLNRRISWKIVILIRNFFFEIRKEACVNLFAECLLSQLFKLVDTIHLFVILKDRRLIYHETKNSQLNVISFSQLILCFFGLRIGGGLFSWEDEQVVILSLINFRHSICDGEWICTPKTMLSA